MTDKPIRVLVVEGEAPEVGFIEAGYLFLATAAVLWRFKKLPEPVVVLAAALIGLVVYPLVAHV